MGEKCKKIRHFLGRTCEWYRYPLCKRQVVPGVVPVPIDSEGVVPIPIDSEGLVAVPLLPATLFLHIYAPISPIFIHQLFRDPKK